MAETGPVEATGSSRRTALRLAGQVVAEGTVEELRLWRVRGPVRVLPETRAVRGGRAVPGGGRRPRRDANGRRAGGRRRARRLRRPGARLADRSRSRPRVVRRGVRRLLEHGRGLSLGDAVAHTGDATRRRRASSISAARSSWRRSPRCSSRERCSSTRARRSASVPALRCSSRSRCCSTPATARSSTSSRARSSSLPGSRSGRRSPSAPRSRPRRGGSRRSARRPLSSRSRDPSTRRSSSSRSCPSRSRAAGGRGSARTIAFVGVAAVLLGAWAGTNLWRYDDLAVARGGQASFPFFRTFTVDRIVAPENGEASRELAALVERELLPRSRIARTASTSKRSSPVAALACTRT